MERMEIASTFNLDNYDDIKNVINYRRMDPTVL